jgi:formate-dependent nitrite reductase membrane component NrfD
MAMPDFIRRFTEMPKVKKFIEENSTLKIFFTVVAGIVTVVGLIGKIFDLDKPVALWLSHAIKTDPTTKTPELELWFIPVVFIALLITASLALLIIWAITRQYAQTKDQTALQEFMSAVRQIRDQGKQTRVKAWDMYLVASVTRQFPS